MNDRQLKSFVRAAELQSFAKAAKEAYITSPALINQINTLEKDIGVELFNRNTHGISLSREGQVFFRAAKQILEVYDKAVEECASLPAEDNVIRCGITASMISVFTSFGFGFKKRHPDYNLSFIGMDYKEISSALNQGKADVIYCAEPAEVIAEEAQFVPVDECPLCVVVSPEHPLAKASLVTAQMLKEYEVVTFNFNKRLKNPAALLTDENVEFTLLDSSISRTALLNCLMENKVLVVSNASFTQGLPNVSVVKTNMDAGWFGFMTPKNHSPKVDVFITDYLEVTGVTMQAAV